MNATSRAPSTALIRVLLVDNDLGDRKLVTDLLDQIQGTRFLIEAVGALTDGRDRLEHARYDVCLLALNLPDGDGLDLLASMEVLGPTLPVVALADCASIEQDRRALALGASGFLDKNQLDPATLERAVRYGIHQHEIAAGLARQALRDEATGLISPALYRDRLDRALAFARRRDREVAVMMIDLAFDPKLERDDRLTDAVLAKVGKQLAGELRETDSIARLAERRLGLLIEGMRTPNHAAMVAKKVLRRLRTGFDVEGRAIDLVPSMGIAIYPREGGEGDLLLRRAESALRQALAEGGGCCRFSSERIDHEARAEMVQEKAFAAAFERRELRLRFHPEVHFGAGRTGLAGEVFWRHPDQGWLPLDARLAVSDDETLIKGIVDWALAAAAEQLLAWEQRGLKRPRLTLSMPFRRRPTLALLKKAVLAQVTPRQIAADRIELEIAEDLVLADIRHGFSDLAELKATDVRLALDGFGQGRVAIQDLGSDVLDSVRLAPGLCRRLAEDDRAKTLIRALVNLGHDLGLSVTAKGARDHHQFALLKQLGCDALQLAAALPPMNAAAAASWLRTRPPGLEGKVPTRAARSPEIIAPGDRLPGQTAKTARPLLPPD